MTTRALRLGAACLGLALAVAATPVPPALAGDNMPGKPYENKVVGFRFKPLNEWSAVPPGTDPDNPKLCGFYSDAAKFEHTVAKPSCEVFAFKLRSGEGTATPGTGGEVDPDPSKPPTEEELRRMAMAGARFQSTRAVFDTELKEKQTGTEASLAGIEEKKRKKMMKDIDQRPPVEKVVKGEDVEITIVEAEAPWALTTGRNDIFIVGMKLVAGWIRNDEYEVGVLYQIPSAGWKKYDNGVYASLRSLEFLSGEDIAAARQDLADALVGKTGDERWLEEIKRKVGPGWAYLQTKNYLVVYDKVVKPDRVKLIAVQIEAIRKDVYEVMFPPDRPVTAISVVRVCKDKEQYTQYGGNPQSAGYWYSVAQELVFYEDTSAKKDSLRVLNHEAFHQFIFYSVGSISPHDWFNEGHGDYFSGHDYNKSGKFVAKPFAWRQGLIKGAMGAKKYIPLKTFVKYSHAEYYGPLIGQNYAQGWSLIWFLRGTRNPEWKGMLEKYFNTLKGEVTRWVDEQVAAAKTAGTWKEGWRPAFTPDDVEDKARSMALESIFGGWDDRKWDRFEKEWLDFKY
jgi:hypothetical protein